MTEAEDNKLGIFHVKATCKMCAGEYIALEYETLKRQRIATTTGMCFLCSDIEADKFKAIQAERLRQIRIERFGTFCPLLYLNCRQDRLPRPDFYQKVVKPLKNGVGQLIIGPSRSGKTFCAYALLRLLYVELARSCFATSEVEFSYELSTFGKSAAALNFINRCCGVDFLLIDDLGKSVMTERVASTLYHVIEKRANSKKPLIVTMQTDTRNFMEKLAAKAGKDTSEAILKRLSEFCEVIDFGEATIPSIKR